MTPYDGAPPPFGVTASVEHDHLLLVVEGEVDAISAPSLQAAAEAYAEQALDIVLDVRGVTFIDSAGLNALIAVQRLAATRGGGVRLVHGVGTNSVLRLLRIVGLDMLFALQPGHEEG